MHRILLLSLTCLLFTLPVSAGVVFEIEVTDHEQSPPKTSTTKVAAEGLDLMMTVQDPTQDVTDDAIFRGKQRKMVVVDHSKKSYMVIDREMIDGVSDQVNAAMVEARKAMEGLSEDQRRMMEKMLEEHMPTAAQAAPDKPQLIHEATREKAEKHGYPCTKHIFKRNGKIVRELWVTPWENIPQSEATANVFLEMSSFFEDLMAQFSTDLGGGATPGGLEGNIFQMMDEIGGFPVVTKEFGDDGSLDSESNLLGAKERDIDPDAFEPPSGYKLRTMGPQ